MPRERRRNEAQRSRRERIARAALWASLAAIVALSYAPLLARLGILP
jgi:hypothetical protein